MSNSLAKIHIAKKDLGLDETAYRAILVRITGKDSSGNMSERQRRAVLAEFQRLGWKPKTGGKPRPGSNKPFVRLMYALAKNIGQSGYWELPYKDALRAFVKKETGIDNPEWLTFQQASPVIEALKKIEQRGRE
ncbi:MAG: regulatory protein GemA [Cohaesibacter sp.]|nr:regulatory protein GemA [Cohaesibacter sp.]